MAKNPWNDLMDDTFSDSSEDSFKQFKGKQKVPGIPILLKNSKNPTQELFAKTSPSVLRFRKSLFVKHLTSLTSYKKPFSSSTPMLKASVQPNASGNFLQISPINQSVTKGSIANQRKLMRKSKSFETIVASQKKSRKQRNPIIDSVVEQLQNISTQYKKNISKKNLNPTTSTHRGTSIENKNVHKKVTLTKPSLVNKSVATSPGEEPTIVKSPLNRKTLVEMQTQTTASLLKPNIIKESQTNKPIQSMNEQLANTRNKVRVNLEAENQFVDSETSTSQTSEIDTDGISNQINENASERDVEEYLKSFDTVIEISSTLENSPLQGNVQDYVTMPQIQNNSGNLKVVIPRLSMVDNASNNAKNDDSSASSSINSKDTTITNQQQSNTFKVPKDANVDNAANDKASNLIEKTDAGEAIPNTSSIASSTNANVDNEDKKKRRPKRSKNKINVFKTQSSKVSKNTTAKLTQNKTSRKSSLQQTQPRTSKSTKFEKPRLTRNTSAMFQPYIPINRFSGFVQISSESQISNQQIDKENNGLRRSTRIRNPPQLFIQSSIFNPNVLRPKQQSDSIPSQTSLKDKNLDSVNEGDEINPDILLKRNKRNSKNKAKTLATKESKKEAKPKKKQNGRATCEENESLSIAKEDAQENKSLLISENDAQKKLKHQEVERRVLRSTTLCSGSSIVNDSGLKMAKSTRQAANDNYVSEVVDSGVGVSGTLNNPVSILPILSNTADTTEPLQPPSVIGIKRNESQSTTLSQGQLGIVNDANVIDKPDSSEMKQKVSKKRSCNNKSIKKNSINKTDSHMHESVLFANAEENELTEIDNYEQENMFIENDDRHEDAFSEIGDRQDDLQHIQHESIEDHNSDIATALNAQIQSLTINTTRDTEQKNISHKRSVTFVEPPIPKPKRLKQQQKNFEHTGIVSRNSLVVIESNNVIDRIDQEDYDIEEVNTNNILHAVVNNEVFSYKWNADTPLFTNCDGPLTVNYCFKNIKTSWGQMSSGYIIISPKESKPLQVMRKHNITYKVERGRGIITAERKKKPMEVGNLFYIPLGVEYSIVNLLDEPLILFFTKLTP